MPYTDPSKSIDVWERRARRILINGPPNSGKTTSLRTWERPLHVIVAPGEKGTETILRGLDGITLHSWEAPAGAVNWIGELADLQKRTFEVLAGKYGPVTTIAVEGLHKLFPLFLNVVTGGAYSDAKDFEAKKYGPAGILFFAFVEKVCESGVKNAVFTCWDGLEKDDPDEKGANPSRHIFPELPGKAAKNVMGEFTVVLYATREGSGPAAKYVWQTQPFGRVWAAGAKMPLEIVKRLPLTLAQDWKVLEKVLLP